MCSDDNDLDNSTLAIMKNYFENMNINYYIHNATNYSNIDKIII